MGNLYANLPSTSGNGQGAAVDVSDYGQQKTVTVAGSFTGVVNIQVSLDGGATWADLISFYAADERTVPVACDRMRVSRSGVDSQNPGQPAVEVGSTDNGTVVAALAVPAGNGTGAAVDVTALGSFHSATVVGVFTGTIFIEISQDGGDWAEIFTFNTPGSLQSAVFTAAFARVRRSGTDSQAPGTAVVNIAGINDASGGGGGPPTGSAGGDLASTYPNPTVVALQSATTRVAVNAATAPTSGQVLTATSATNATWQTPPGGVVPWTTVTTAGTVNNQAVATNALRFTAATVLTGLENDGTEKEVILYNASASNLLLFHNSGSSTAGNRFICQGAATQTVPPQGAYIFKWNIAQAAWLFVGTRYPTGNTPISVNAAGAISMTIATTSQAGYLLASDWNTFNNKIGGTGVADRVPYYSAANTLTNSTALVFRPATQRLGVQQSNPTAAVNIASTITENAADPISISASLIEVVSVDPPTAASATQTAGQLMNPTAPGAVENNSNTSSWGVGTTVDYTIIPYYFDGTDYFYGAAGTVFPQVTIATDFNGVDLSWADDTSGTQPLSGYRLYRNVNGSGLNEFLDIGLVTSFSDDSVSMTGESYPPSPQFGDYIANGTTRDYSAYAYKDEVFGRVYSSSPLAYSMTDNGSGQPYLVSHGVDSPSGTARVIGAPDGSSADSYIDGTAFVESPSSWTPGADVSPAWDSVGFVSDGSILNFDYSLYRTQTISGTFCYSPSPQQTSTVDPNNGARYVVQLNANYGVPGTGGKIIASDATGILFVGGSTATVWHGYTNFPDGTTNSPVGVPPTALLVEAQGASIATPAAVAVRGLQDYARIELQNAALAATAILEGLLAEGTLRFAAGNPVARWNATQLGFFNQAPADRPSAVGQTSGFVAGSGTASRVDSTYTGGVGSTAYTVGDVVRALKLLGLIAQ